ncbi:lycopene cyclase family protein [Amycolatopsis sp. 195334CR]|uniref:lycopene cyclase family protein n=1 Tax=Amycolatopsis sp. 195334CR TaxID=2814588 RepID=UPI001A8C216D|nr:lycopene cyclase family protein [Amycolatopsis sp. 195334CR]MBN6040726.1 lycopene cyclase [Amycolatopsis sp. 195334CR]
MHTIIAGGGPAGWALAAACARAGVRVALVDPAPRRAWAPVYGVWRDEVPGLPDSAVAAVPHTVLATAVTTHTLDREYVVIDNAGLRAWLDHPAVEVITGRAESVTRGDRGATVRLTDGRRLACAVAVDATGARRALTGGPARRPAEQTAFGLALDEAAAERVTGHSPGTAVFMDWRPAHADFPTFLYSLPLGNGRTLVEETCLAAKPGLPQHILSARLRARLTAAGVVEPRGPERVRIPLDLPIPRTLAFGVAGGFAHPATGYSLGTALRLASPVAQAIAAASTPREADRAARAVVASAAAREVHALRRFGLRVLTRLPSAQVPEFFEMFFSLPPDRQRAYLSGREDLAGTAAAMTGLFRRAPWRIRTRMV